MLLKHNPEFCTHTGKKKYETMKKAKREGIKVMKRRDKNKIKYIHPYKCFYCNTYHWRIDRTK